MNLGSDPLPARELDPRVAAAAAAVLVAAAAAGVVGAAGDSCSRPLSEGAPGAARRMARTPRRPYETVFSGVFDECDDGAGRGGVGGGSQAPPGSAGQTDAGLLPPGQTSLGRRQTVRHRPLEPAFGGSNPPAPANLQF